MAKSIVKNSFYSSLRNVSMLIFPIITFAYASRILLSDGIGKIDFSNTFIMYFVMIAMLGIDRYGIRECARVRDNKKELNKSVKEILSINAISVIISYLLLIILILLIDKLNNYRELLFIFSFNIGLTALGMDWLYNAVEDYKYIAIRTVVFQVLSLCLMFIFVKEKQDINNYAIIQVVSASGSNIMNFIHSRKYINLFERCKLQLKKHIKPVLVIFITIVSIKLYVSINTTVLGFLTTDKIVGLYSASFKISAIAGLLISSITLVLAPRIAYFAEMGMFDEIKSITKKSINFILMLCIPMTMGFVLLSKPILLIFSGGDFIDADFTAKIMSLRALFVPFNTFITSHLLIPLRKEKYPMLSTAVAAIVNVILVFILIPILSLNGAAISTVIAELVISILGIFFLSKIMKVKPIIKESWQYFIASLVIVPAYFLFNSIINNIYIMTCLVVVVSVVVYFIILILLKNEYVYEAKQYINNYIDKKRRK